MDFLLSRIFTSVFTALHNYSEAKHHIYLNSSKATQNPSDRS